MIAPSGVASGVRNVDDVLITAELASRPSPIANYEAESRALGLLAQEMATNPRGVLQKCAELVMELCGADSAGISILEPGGTSGMLRWHAAAGELAANLHGIMPPEASPCGTVMERNSVLLFKEAERFFPALRDVEPRIYENLLAPWHVEGKAVGTIWAIKHTAEGRFDAEDARVLQSIAGFAAVAFQMTSALAAATEERNRFKQSTEALHEAEARLRAASELVGLGVYSWDPNTGALDWDNWLRAMWGLPNDAHVDMEVYEAAIHPEDLSKVRKAIAECVDPNGDGKYAIEYRVVGRDDGITRNIATSGRTSFTNGRATGFIGAAIDVTAQRTVEAAVRSSEAQFRSFAEHSSNLLWIADTKTNTIIYRSAAYERIWGISSSEGPTNYGEWMKDVHPEDRRQVEHALASAKKGEVVQFEYRIIRPADGATRWLRDTSFPIPDDAGVIIRIGGICEDLTREDVQQAYIVSSKASEARKLGRLVRALGYRARIFDSATAFLDIAAVLAPGCVIVDLRKSKEDGLSVPRELKARSIALPTIALDSQGASTAIAIAAMKAGAIDFVVMDDEASLRTSLAAALTDCHGSVRPSTRDENAGAKVARLTPREQEVLVGLVNGGTNKTIAQALGISPRTVELHRSQVMSRLDATSLTELLQVALAAGVKPAGSDGREQRNPT